MSVSAEGRPEPDAMVNGIHKRDTTRRPFSPEWMAELRASFTVMIRVVYAVILRESRTRYGNSNIGYAWAIIDPVIQLTVFVGAFVLLGRTSPVAAPLSVFFLTGIVPLFFWRGVVSQSANAVKASLGLLSYPQVMPSDVVIARILLESATTIIVFICIVIGLALVADVSPSFFFGDPLEIVLATIGLVYFTIGCGFLSSGLGRVLPVWTNIWGYMGRPIYLLSGIFFTLEQLPDGARQYMAYIPVAHSVEWLRSAMIPTFESHAYNPWYPAVFGTVALLIGLIIDRILLMTGDEEIVS
jgi:capsular polysaccharide transport system permease protein